MKKRRMIKSCTEVGLLNMKQFVIVSKELGWIGLAGLGWAGLDLVSLTKVG